MKWDVLVQGVGEVIVQVQVLECARTQRSLRTISGEDNQSFVAVTYWYAFGSMPVFQERVRGDKQVAFDFAIFKVMSRDERTYEECFERLAKLVLRYV